jgi:hypothetical protein
MRKSILALTIVSTFALLQPAAPALAQDGPPPMAGCVGMQPGQHIEGRLAFLKTELKITDAQAPQWNAYADALRANAKRKGEMMHAMAEKGMCGPGMMGGGMMGGMMGGGMMGGGMGQGMGMGMSQTTKRPSLPDRLDLMEQHMSAHMEMLGTIKEPALKLYEVLTSEQKEMADQLMVGHMGMM